MDRRWLRALLCAMGCAGIAVILLLAALSPNTNNRGLEGVAFSRPSGFYSGEFYLEMEDGGQGEIHYTLDSSDPDANSPVYAGPILITDSTPNENVYSMITDVSLEFREELLVEAGSTLRFGYRLPEGLVDKATVVRAVSINAEGEATPVTSAVYFVDYDDKEGYNGMRVVSITTDPDNLFGFENGIYVTGKKFEDTLEDGHVVPPLSNNYGTWEANYRAHGRAWEREAYVVCFDEDRNVLFSGNYGLRIQGGASRGLLPKSLNLFARKEYGASSFSYDALFGCPGQLDSINLHSGAQCVRTKLNDYLVTQCSEGMNYATREYVPSVVFLDGEFWGFYWMTPRFEEEYFRYRYNAYDDNLMVMKAGAMEIGEPGDEEELYQTMRAFICDHDMSDPEMYAQACQLIDVQSCIDYFATEIYIANVDWPHHNVMLWRTKEVSSGACCDARWRWILYDVNVSMERPYAERDMVEWAIKRSDMFAALMENESFSRGIYEKLMELAENNYNPARIDDFIDDYKLFMGDTMEKEYARFYGDSRDLQSFYDRCDAIKNFFDRRYDYITEKYAEYGGAR